MGDVRGINEKLKWGRYGISQGVPKSLLLFPHFSFTIFSSVFWK